MPVRERLLLVLPEKEIYDYLCTGCAESLGQREVTAGEITSVRSPKMRQWVWDRVGPQAQKLMTVYEDGAPKASIDKNVRANLLVLAEENHEEVPAPVAHVIQCADDIWASSVAKFSRLAQLADAEDRRVRGAFVFS